MDKASVIYEDNHLLVVNKRSGILVQGDITGDRPLVDLCKDYIKEKYAKPGEVFLGLVHRIDRPVSGVVAFARTSKALSRMNKLFKERETIKTYWAVVDEKPARESGTLLHWLVKDEKKNKTTVYSRETTGALRSELSYKTLGSERNQYLLEVKPLTGRPHQIRVQLSSMGCSIVGDVKYGATEPNSDASICLHSKSLEFIHPVKKVLLKVSAPLPRRNEWKSFLKFDI